jgi:hypothetical protein
MSDSKLGERSSEYHLTAFVDASESWGNSHMQHSDDGGDGHEQGFGSHWTLAQSNEI